MYHIYDNVQQNHRPLNLIEAGVFLKLLSIIIPNNEGDRAYFLHCRLHIARACIRDTCVGEFQAPVTTEETVVRGNRRQTRVRGYGCFFCALRCSMYNSANYIYIHTL